MKLGSRGVGAGDCSCLYLWADSWHLMRWSLVVCTDTMVTKWTNSGGGNLMMVCLYLACAAGTSQLMPSSSLSGLGMP